MSTTPTQFPVPSEKPQDLKFNAGKIDEFVTSMGWTYTDRFGDKHYTIEGIRHLAQEVMDTFGFIALPGVTFTTGATLTEPNDVLFNEADNSYYRWSGSFAAGPKVVPPDSTPESSGGIGPGKWLNVGDTMIRSDLNKIDAYSMVGSGNYSDIRGYTGTNNVIYCHGINDVFDGGFGYFDLDPSDTSTADNGGTVLVDANGRRWKRRISDGVIHAEWFGMKQDWNGTSGTDNSIPINKAISVVPVSGGKVIIPVGEYGAGGMISANRSNIVLEGHGTDITLLRFFGITSQAGIEVNNGSWDYSTNTYTLSGNSIGSTIIRNLTINGFNTTSSTGILLARATLGCMVENVKIVTFSVASRAYGSWYLQMRSVIYENNQIGQYIDHATNDVLFDACKWISNPAAQSKIHFEAQGMGSTCHALTFASCSFDGLPTLYGLYIKGVHNVTFSGSTYIEVYSSEIVKTSNFMIFGAESSVVKLDGLNITLGEGYSGTVIQCGTGTSGGNPVGVNTMTISNCYQYNSGANTGSVVDTTNGTNVIFGDGNRFAQGVIIPNVSSVTGTTQTISNIQALSGTNEIKMPICSTLKAYTVPVLKIRVQFLAPFTVSGTQFLRVLNSAGNVLIEAPITGSITAGTVYNLTDNSSGITTSGRSAINSILPRGEVLTLYTYKVGASTDWPPINVMVEQP